MKRFAKTLLFGTLAAASLAACQSDQESTNVATEPVDDPAAESQAEHAVEPASAVATRKQTALPQSPGKLSAPITFDYTITGNPVVGQPVGVEVEVSSPLNDRPITLHYRMNEVGSMTFPASQADRMTLAPRADAGLRRQQLTLVPRREGRLFVVVSAEIETENGTMMKSMSIPIQVGRAAPSEDTNGELVEGTDGELGVSMPSKEPR